ncbi:MAG: LysR family transcriptional regulator [Clostridiales bacterium]|nr:LysR family transcriptional regulator [Clostridiales bacterium]
MDLQQMFYFVKIAESESMRKAAEEISISQPALSQACKSLENEIGLKLFYKKGRVLGLTSAGQIFYEHARDILSRVDMLKNEMDRLVSENQNSLVICGGVADFAVLSANLFQKMCPEVSLKVLRCGHQEGKNRIENGKADFHISLINNNTTCREKLLEEPMYVLLNKQHPLAKRKRISIVELKNETMVLQREIYDAYHVIEDIFARAGIRWLKTVEVNDPENIAYKISCASGVGLIGMYTAKRHGYTLRDKQERWERPDILVPDNLVAVPLEESFCSRDIYVFWQKGRKMRSVDKKYLEFLHRYTYLTQEYGRYPYLDEL